MGRTLLYYFSETPLWKESRVSSYLAIGVLLIDLKPWYLEAIYSFQGRRCRQTRLDHHRRIENEMYHGVYSLRVRWRSSLPKSYRVRQASFSSRPVCFGEKV